MLIEKYTIVENTQCDNCGATTDCFQYFKLDDGVPTVDYTLCGEECDLDTDPRGAECIEDLQDPNNWKEVA